MKVGRPVCEYHETCFTHVKYKTSLFNWSHIFVKIIKKLQVSNLHSSILVFDFDLKSVLSCSTSIRIVRGIPRGKDVSCVYGRLHGIQG